MSNMQHNHGEDGEESFDSFDGAEGFNDMHDDSTIREHDGGEHGEHGDYDESSRYEDHDEQHEQEANAAPKKSRKTLYALLGVLGAGALVFLGYTTFLSGDNTPAPQPRVASAPPHFQHGPAMPQQSIKHLETASLSPPSSSAPSLSVPPSLPPQNNGDVAKTPAQNVADTGKDLSGSNGTSSVESAVLKLVNVTQDLDTNLNTRFKSMDDNISEMKTAITQRLDNTDKNVSQINLNVQNIDTRLDNFDTRLKILEGGRVSHHETASAPVNETHERHVSRHVSKRTHVPHHREEASPVSDAHHIEGYTLRGIEKVAAGRLPQSAWVQTPGGFVVVTVGQSAGQLGVIKRIAPHNGVWTVETSAGVVTP